MGYAALIIFGKCVCSNVQKSFQLIPSIDDARTNGFLISLLGLYAKIIFFPEESIIADTLELGLSKFIGIASLQN